MTEYFCARCKKITRHNYQKTTKRIVRFVCGCSLTRAMAKKVELKRVVHFELPDGRRVVKKRIAVEYVVVE